MAGLNEGDQADRCWKNGWGTEEEQFGLKKLSPSDNYIDKLINMANK